MAEGPNNQNPTMTQANSGPKTESRDLSLDEGYELARQQIDQGQWADAHRLVGKILEINGAHAGALFLMGKIAKQAGNKALALAAWEQARSNGAMIAELYQELAEVALANKQMDKARDLLGQALAINPDLAMAHFAFGNYHRMIGDDTSALECFRLAANCAPKDLNIVFTYGYLLDVMGHDQEARLVYHRVLELDPNNKPTLINLGRCCRRLNMLGEAIVYTEKCHNLEPDNDDYGMALGAIYIDIGEYYKAIAVYKKLLEADPKNHYAGTHLALVYHLLGRAPEAVVELKKYLDLYPDNDQIWNSYIWGLGYEPDLSLADAYAEYERFNDVICKPYEKYWRPHTNNPDPNRRLKVGYMSPDFGNHSIKYCLEPLMRLHDRNEVEVYAFALVPPDKPNCEDVKAAVDHWYATEGMTPEERAQLIRDLEIDIVLELSGHGVKNDLLTLAQKPAPVSISTMGYGRTTGVKAIDYFAFPEDMYPLEYSDYLAEKPWPLKAPAVCFDASCSNMGEPSELPALKNGYVTFASFSRSIRLNYRVIRTWSELLKRLPNAKLVLNSGTFSCDDAKTDIIRHFADYGIDESRLDLGYDTPPWDKYREVDIMLDCFPHNSGATLLEGLYLGLPFVTLIDLPGIGQMGRYILGYAGHPEWGAETEEAYVDIAVDLASDLDRLAHIRRTLRDDCEKHHLFDLEGYARRTEEMFREMWKIWCDTQTNPKD